MVAATTAINDVLAPPLGNGPGAGRTRRVLTTVLISDDEVPEGADGSSHRTHVAAPRMPGNRCQLNHFNRSPSNTMAHKAFTSSSAPMPRRGRYHSTSELTAPNTRRATNCGSTSARSSPAS